MALEDRPRDLGKIRARDDFNTFFVASVNQVPEIKIINKEASCVVLQVRIIAGDQSGCVEHNHVAGKLFQLRKKPLFVKVHRIDLSEIGLDHAPGVICPPVSHLHPPCQLKARRAGRRLSLVMY